jgi:hypothetical protein
MFTPRDLQLRNLKAPDKSKNSPLSQSGDAPALQDPVRPTQLPEAGAH